MRINYKTYPTDYIQQLKRDKGIKGRKKSRAFMEYWDDMEHGDHNSVRFYAKSWETSSSTAHGWIDEFNKEIDLFLSHWTLRNNKHYTYVQNQAEHQPNKTNTHQAPSLGKAETSTEHQPNKVFNINNNKSKAHFFDRHFEDMYSRCRFSNKYTGSKQDAYDEYMQNHQHISHNDMAYAYMIHSNDPQINGKCYNLKNFMSNQAYLNYLSPQIEIKKDDKTIIGYYNQTTGTVTTDSNIQYSLTKEKFASMVSSGEITITSKMKVA